MIFCGYINVTMWPVCVNDAGAFRDCCSAALWWSFNISHMLHKSKIKTAFYTFQLYFYTHIRDNYYNKTFVGLMRLVHFLWRNRIADGEHSLSLVYFCFQTYLRVLLSTKSICLSCLIGWRFYGSLVHKEVAELSVLNMPRPDFAFIFIIWKRKVVHILSLIWWWWTRRGTQWTPNSVMTLWGDPFGPSELRWCYWEVPVWESPAWHCSLSGVNSGARCRQWAVSSSWCL